MTASFETPLEKSTEQQQAKRLLSISDLLVSFRTEAGRLTAVDNVNLTLDEGETLAIVGESGSGKSVTALSILQLLGDAGRVDRGRIEFNGTNLLDLDINAIRAIRGERIAMIFQEPMTSLNPVISIGRQVAEPVWLHRKKSWKDAMAHAGELLKRVAIPDAEARLGDFPHHFSGGMRQRVMIAMALACDPQLIIADEPTTALDVTVQAQILDLLKDLTRETNAALVLITHDLGVVARYADRVAVMYAGRIVESATAQALYEQPHHPYTQGLMASIPSLDGIPGRRLETIEGQPPDLADLPPGCAYAPRCPHARDLCTRQAPALRGISTSQDRLHQFACIGIPQ